MFRRPYYFQFHCLVRAFEHTDSTAQAVLVNDKSLHLFRAGDLSHLDGVKGTLFDAGLAARAFLRVYDHPKPAGIDQLVHLAAFNDRIE